MWPPSQGSLALPQGLGAVLYLADQTSRPDRNPETGEALPAGSRSQPALATPNDSVTSHPRPVYQTHRNLNIVVAVARFIAFENTRTTEAGRAGPCSLLRFDARTLFGLLFQLPPRSGEVPFLACDDSFRLI